MLNKIKRILTSIALLPSGLALFFLLFAIIFNNIEIDYEHHAFFKYFSISDKDDTKSILSFIIGGIFTLTVFSYTMVMNVLQRNINNYSPRVVPLLLSQKSHQIILGFTLGTIIYSMVMMVSLTNDAHGYFPTLTAGLGVLLTIICILLFIHFLHTISRSVHINHILDDLVEMTNGNLKSLEDRLEEYKKDDDSQMLSVEVKSEECGYLRLPRFEKLNEILDKENATLRIEKLFGQFVYKGDVLYTLDQELDKELIKKIEKQVALDSDVILDAPETGFKHFVEVIVKANSPAINDPGTSLAGINYITQMLKNRHDIIDDEFTSYYSNEKLAFKSAGTREVCVVCFTEIFYYCKNDPVLRRTIKESIEILNNHCNFKNKLTQEDINGDW